MVRQTDLQAHRRLRIMVVDDDLITLEVLRERLVQVAHHVTVRSSPVGTAADVLSQKIDLIVLDVMMPGLRGDDLARMLKRHPATSNVGIILHSSLSPEVLRPLIMTTGALGAIQKTSSASVFLFTFNCLIAKLKNRTDRVEAPPSGTYSRGTRAPSPDSRAVPGTATVAGRTKVR